MHCNGDSFQGNFMLPLFQITSWVNCQKIVLSSRVTATTEVKIKHLISASGVITLYVEIIRLIN